MYNCYVHGWSSHYSMCPSCVGTKTSDSSTQDYLQNIYFKNQNEDNHQREIEELLKISKEILKYIEEIKNGG